jgi:23S rRNA pseudoU1915 N3-methylase RlmH
MKKFLSIVFIATMMVATTASADATKGQKLYLKKLKSACDLNGAKMAAKHTQAEWEAVKDTLADEIKKICPNAEDKALKDKYLPHYYDFFHKFASDSGNVPSC